MKCWRRESNWPMSTEQLSLACGPCQPASPPQAGRLAGTPVRWWLFSAPVDLGVFLGSAAVALLALAVGAHFDLLQEDRSEVKLLGELFLPQRPHRQRLAEVLAGEHGRR